MKVIDRLSQPLRPLRRFWRAVDCPAPDACWTWQRSRTPLGYGQAWMEGRQCYAHRVAYELLVGPIPQGLELDHLCRNPCCVNPAHLEPVTHAENVRRGFSEIGRHHLKTHCPSGHAYSGENLITRPNGSRLCRVCQRAHVRAHRAAKQRQGVMA